MSILQRIDRLSCEKLDLINSLTWNRLDKAFELFYLDLVDKNKNIAEKVYLQSIKLRNIKNHYKRTLAYDSEVKFDYKFYQIRGLDEKIIEAVINKFIEYSKDTYIAFLWPAGKGHRDKVHSKFTKIVYKKDIKLTPRGAFNLIYESYRSADWLGDKTNNYEGTHEKVVKCFPDFTQVTIIVFQSESLESVRKLKEDIRSIYKIGYDSVHTTDSKEEAVRLSRLVLNENGRHFLNYSNPHKYDFFKDNMNLAKKHISKKKLAVDDLLLDEDITLSIYGIREPSELRYLSMEDSLNYNKIESSNKLYEDKKNLIYNPLNYFYYCDLKFLSFQKTYEMQSIKNMEKMNIMIKNTAKNYKTLELKQKFMYTKIRFKLKTIDFMKDILKKIKLFEIVKEFYNKTIK